ncbi:Sieve element occlusion [Trema orientale]|uniref:Sieve element occlusion n=1 Tax=Trema orientale TaxID=63057 RepID=A0A2P5BX27_TREOI|nr:Sieve element occlusion [Trema orientale]
METYSFQIREEQIKLQIDDTHAPYGDPFDTYSLFIIVANILKRSTKIVEAFVEQGDIIKVSLDNKEDQDKPKESFRVPMCILKNIGCELFSCKDPGAEIAHETTLKILKKLQNYQWEAKVVLTLAAFAKEFGDLLHLDQVINTQDQLTKSLAILKGSLILPNTPLEKRQRRRSAVLELNNLIKETLSVIEIIIRESEKSYSSSQRIAELLKPINVYWIVMTVIACANKVTILTSEDLEKPFDLSFYERKIREYKSVLIRLIGPKEVEKSPFEQPKVVEQDEREYYELLKVESNKYIILHGGIDQEWTKEIEAKVNFISMEANIKIELFNINQLNLEAFWSSVHTLLSKLYTGKYAKKQLERLYSYKQAKGWFFLNKGSTTVVVGSQESFLKAVAEFDKWKVDIRRRTLEVAFKEYHESIITDLAPGPITTPPPVTVPPESRKYINGCLIIENPSLDGKLLKQMNCPTCTLDMEMIGVTYRCCHTSKSSFSYY